ncbi:hypothetical protein GCM10029963_69280 [Micromonospora andamanensis]|nr:hypothetical protein Vwe01_22320 [Micromonospora andamanensis]
MFGLVRVGVGIPPAAVGGAGLGVTDLAPGHPVVVVHQATLGPDDGMAGGGPPPPYGVSGRNLRFRGWCADE